MHAGVNPARFFARRDHGLDLGVFSRQLFLGENLDTDKIEASYRSSKRFNQHPKDRAGTKLTTFVTPAANGD